MRGLEAIEGGRIVALAAVTVAIAGCGDAAPQHEIGITEPDPQENTMSRSLEQYRKSIEKGVADIALGICVAWPNQEGGMTVVSNPGLADYSRGAEGVDSFVTFLAGSAGSSEATVMDGPSLFEPSMFIYGDPPDRFTGGPTTVHISKSIKDSAGGFYFEDTNTSEKVMYTALVDGPVTLRNARAECDKMSGKETDTLVEKQSA